MHVHIAFAGKKPEYTLKAIDAIPAIDRFIILYSKTKDNLYKRNAEAIRDELGRRPCDIMPVDAFDFNDIVDTIYECFEKEVGDDKKNRLSINITNGTNLMAAAACTTAFFTNATVYYMMDGEVPELRGKCLEDLLVTVPSPKIPNIRALREDTIDVLRYIGEMDHEGRMLINAEIAGHFGITQQGMSYHIKRLINAGLIEYDMSGGKHDNRQKPIRLKREGRFILKYQFNN